MIIMLFDPNVSRRITNADTESTANPARDRKMVAMRFRASHRCDTVVQHRSRHRVILRINIIPTDESSCQTPTDLGWRFSFVCRFLLTIFAKYARIKN